MPDHRQWNPGDIFLFHLESGQKIVATVEKVILFHSQNVFLYGTVPATSLLPFPGTFSASILNGSVGAHLDFPHFIQYELKPFQSFLKPVNTTEKYIAKEFRFIQQQMNGKKGSPLPIHRRRRRSSSQIATPDPANLQILVLYTAQSVAACGSEACILIQISLAVGNFNIALQNSQINVAVKYVAERIQEYDTYIESTDMAVILSQMGRQISTARRNVLNCHAVHLVSSNIQYCGIAQYDYYGRTGGYSVSYFGCIGGYLSLAHEIAHNIGLQHNASAFGGTTANHGYCWDSNQTCHRSVMAYASCTTPLGKTNCDRVKYFSNPQVFEMTVPVGLADFANNALQFQTNIGGFMEQFTPSFILAPTAGPSTAIPSTNPTQKPSRKPTFLPTFRPSKPTFVPSRRPTRTPTRQPSTPPTTEPSTPPTQKPSVVPTRKPTKTPTQTPSRVPSIKPTQEPSGMPTPKPTRPTERPTWRPSLRPSGMPTQSPTMTPTRVPTRKPTYKPSWKPFYLATTAAPIILSMKNDTAFITTIAPTGKRPVMVSYTGQTSAASQMMYVVAAFLLCFFCCVSSVKMMEIFIYRVKNKKKGGDATTAATQKALTDLQKNPNEYFSFVPTQAAIQTPIKPKTEHEMEAQERMQRRYRVYSRTSSLIHIPTTITEDPSGDTETEPEMDASGWAAEEVDTIPSTVHSVKTIEDESTLFQENEPEMEAEAEPEDEENRSLRVPFDDHLESYYGGGIDKTEYGENEYFGFKSGGNREFKRPPPPPFRSP